MREEGGGKERKIEQREDVERGEKSSSVTVQRSIDWLLLRSQARESRNVKRKPLQAQGVCTSRHS